MKKVFVLIFLAFVFCYDAQAKIDFEIPENYAFNNEADYVKHEKDIIQASKWLVETNLDEQTEKRKAVNAFVFNWISGTSAVSILIDKNLMDLCGENEDFLLVYLSAYASYCIENFCSNSSFEATKLVLQAMMKVYNKGIKIIPNNEMKRMVKATEKGKLDEYIVKNFKEFN